MGLKFSHPLFTWEACMPHYEFVLPGLQKTILENPIAGRLRRGPGRVPEMR